MRILTVSDKVEPVLYGPYIRERVGRLDCIIACGDLPYYYLDYIVSLLDVPLFYVHGNHDQVMTRRDDPNREPDRHGHGVEYGMNLHGEPAVFQGLLLAGLEGCRLYSPGRPYQYTERQVQVQSLQLAVRLLANRARYGRYLDVMVTHAPPRGIHDAEDVAHQGFESYLWLLKRLRPFLMVHGHQHIYNRNLTVETDFDVTKVLNTYGYRVIEIAQRPDGRGWQLVSSSR